MTNKLYMKSWQHHLKSDTMMVIINQKLIPATPINELLAFFLLIYFQEKFSSAEKKEDLIIIPHLESTTDNNRFALWKFYSIEFSNETKMNIYQICITISSCIHIIYILIHLFLKNKKQEHLLSFFSPLSISRLKSLVIFRLSSERWLSF
jgi:hypothetical protein